MEYHSVNSISSMGLLLSMYYLNQNTVSQNQYPMFNCYTGGQGGGGMAEFSTYPAMSWCNSMFATQCNARTESLQSSIAECCNVSCCSVPKRKTVSFENLEKEVFSNDPIRDWVEKELSRINKKYAWIDKYDWSPKYVDPIIFEPKPKKKKGRLLCTTFFPF